MSRETKLVKNTFILGIGTFLPKLAAFVTLPILTACLSKEQFGTYDLITVLVSFLLPVATMQIHTAAFRFLIDHKHDKELASVYFTNLIAFVVPVSLTVLAITFFFLPVPDLSLRLWICGYLFFDTIVAEVLQITRGLGRNMDYSISAIISALVKLILTFVLVQLLKHELRGAVIALACSPVLSLIYLIFKIRIYELLDFSLLSWDVLKEMLAYSWPMVPNNMSGWVMRMSDRLVVIAFMGLPANAVYSVANKIPNMLTLAQTAFSMAWQENASIASRDVDAGKYYTKMFSVMLNFYAGCLGLIIACTPILFRLLIRGDYAEAYPQMPLLFLAVFFSCMCNFQGGIYIAHKATRSVGITTVLAAACNLIVDLSLIRHIGLYAASGSTLVSYVVLFIYRMIGARRLVDIRYDFKGLAVALGVILVEAFLCLLNRPVLNIVNICFGCLSFYFLNRQISASMFKLVKRKLRRRG